MPGLVSSWGSALGRLEILPETGAGSMLWLVWGGMWPAGQSLRGGKHDSDPQGVSCSVSCFLPGPSVGAGVSASAGNRTVGQEGPGTGGHTLPPSAASPTFLGMLGCATCRVASAICRGETEARGLKWENLSLRRSQDSCLPGRALQVRMPSQLCCCRAAAWLQGGSDPKSWCSLATEG